MYALAANLVNTVEFKGLNLGPFELNRVAFTIPGTDFAVYWYALLITLGMILAVVFGCFYTRKVGLKSDDVIDAIVWCLVPALAGARAFYVAFEWDMFLTSSGAPDWARIVLGIRDGGLAIYGGIICGFLVAVIMCRVKNIDMLALFDVGALGFMIGQSIGRWGNFMNAEAYGYETDLLWGMSINGNGPFHPTFLYESLWNALGFVLLLLYGKYVKKHHGEIFLGYFTWYGLGRSVIEGLRTDSLWVFNDATAAQLGFNLRISQVIGLLFAVVGLVFLILLYVGVFDKLIDKSKANREARIAAKAAKKDEKEEAEKEEAASYKPLFSDGASEQSEENEQEVAETTEEEG